MMPPATEPASTTDTNRADRRNAAERATMTPRRYAAPALRVLGSADDLLEVLGPAQANYSGPGFP
jgi:hypothetical protein